MSVPVDPDLDRAWVSDVRRKLLAWYDEGHRDLPWRRDRDPYHILVAEMMLVQTTVAAVVPYYERFLRLFPTVHDLSAANESAVLKAWEGLGYYRRARQLHAAARAIVERHGGTMPADSQAVRDLPGVGPYIAGAILSFAFDRPAPILEANTQRVLARWLGWDQEVSLASSQARLWQAAGRLVPNHDAGHFNQAFMELGAVVCTPREPTCLFCPVAAECRARSLGVQDRIPVKRARESPVAVAEACALIVRKGEILIVRRGSDRLWAGFWEFPTVHRQGADPAGRSFDEPLDLAEGVRRLTGMQVQVGPPLRTIRYSVTRHRVDLAVHAGVALRGTLKAGPGMDEVAWERPEALQRYLFGSAGRRLARWVIEQGADTLRQAALSEK